MNLINSIHQNSILDNILLYITEFLVYVVIFSITCQVQLYIVFGFTKFFIHPVSPLSKSVKKQVILFKAPSKFLKHLENSLVIVPNWTGIAKEPLLIQILVRNTFSQYWSKHSILQCPSHYFEVLIRFQDDHITQVVKNISMRYMRLKSESKRYTRDN